MAQRQPGQRPACHWVLSSESPSSHGRKLRDIYGGGAAVKNGGFTIGYLLK